MTDDEAIRLSQLLTFDDLCRWWAKESASQRAAALEQSATFLRANGVHASHIPALLEETAAMLDQLRDDGFARLRSLRGSMLDPPMKQ